MGPETENRKPVAVFMAFGTKGDVYPLSVSISSSNGIAKISPFFLFFFPVELKNQQFVVFSCSCFRPLPLLLLVIRNNTVWF